MRIAPAGSVPGFVSGPGRWAASAVPFVAAGAIAFAIATRVTAPSIGLTLGVAFGLGATVWMFLSERMERPLVLFLLYLGLLDGYVKLKTNSSSITLGRDALLYAVLLGFIARAALRRQSLRLPPLSGWVLAFTVVVLVQVTNPANHGLLHTVGAIRPHLEFVPLFFVGYAMLQTRDRLRKFFMIMLVIATANGVVGMIQLNLTPAQLASWGPGYSERVLGNGTGLGKVSGRVYTTSTGALRTRPFGLGDDAGVGSAWGMLSLCGAIALITSGLVGWRAGRLALLLCIGPPLAIISGQGRSLLISSVIAVIAYICVATTARRLIPTLTAVLVGIAAVIGVVAFVSSVSGAGVFARYATVTPGKLAATTNKDRGGSISRIPTLIVTHPFGYGLGGVGPAAGFAGGGNHGGDGETEPGFLVSELGVPGLIVLYGFMVNLLILGATRIRRLDPDTRSFVAAIYAAVVGLLLLGVSGATTATSPEAPYLWLAGGALSYWLVAGPGALPRAPHTADGSALPAGQAA